MEADGVSSDLRDVGIYSWRRRAVDALDTAIRGAGAAGVQAVPFSDARNRSIRMSCALPVDRYRRGRQAMPHEQVPCHTDLEKRFADFLDGSTDVVRYFKNERLGFSVTYYESNRPRQYFPDFIVLTRDSDGREVTWLAETKGEIRPNTVLKTQAATLWCEKMSGTSTGSGVICSSRKRTSTSPPYPTRSR